MSKFAFRQKNYALQKDALYYSVFKERAEAIEKAPSLSMPCRKVEGAKTKFFNFLKDF